MNWTTLCVFFGMILMKVNRMEGQVSMTAAWLLQEHLFLKVYKFLTEKNCTFRQRRNCTAICGTVYVSYVSTSTIWVICITTRDPKLSFKRLKSLKTPEAHHRAEALNTEIKLLLDTSALRAMNLADAPTDASIINSTMVLRKKPDNYKAHLWACKYELKGQIAEIYSPNIGALTYSTVHQIAIIDRMKMRIINTVGTYLTRPNQTHYRLSTLRCLLKSCKRAILRCCISYWEIYLWSFWFWTRLLSNCLLEFHYYAKLLVDSGDVKSKSDPCLFPKFPLLLRIISTYGCTSTILLLLLPPRIFLTSSRLLLSHKSKAILRVIWGC